jgi:phosphoglycerate dehydrogenase-like enzyme
MEVIAWSLALDKARAAQHGVDLAQGGSVLPGRREHRSPPLAPATAGLIGPQDLARMKPTAYLVNTSRGPIVDEGALIEALREGRITRAGLDVYDTEPLPLHHPLRSLPNTLLLPHIGYVTTDMTGPSTRRRWRTSWPGDRASRSGSSGGRPAPLMSASFTPGAGGAQPQDRGPRRERAANRLTE